LLSTKGFKVPDLTSIFEMTDVTIYKWFDRFDEEGPDGLYDRERSGRPPKLDEEAEEELERVLAHSPLQEGYAFTRWTLPRLREHLRRRLGVDVSDETVRRALDRLTFVWARPRWEIDYEDPDYAARMEAIMEAIFADPETILVEDETSLRQLAVLRRMWMRRGQQVRVPVPEQNKKFSLYGTLEVTSGEMLTASYPTGKSEYTVSFLEQVMAHYDEGEVLLIWDQASYHLSKKVEQAIDQWDRLKVLLLPKRAPQENPIEAIWGHLKDVIAANMSRSIEALKAASRRFFERLSPQEALQIAGMAA
jgi:transposase